MIPGLTEVIGHVVGRAVEPIVQGATITSTQAFGTLVCIEPDDFASIVAHQQGAVVVHNVQGWFRKTHAYLTSFKGLVFCAKSREALAFKEDVLVIEAKKAFIPV